MKKLTFWLLALAVSAVSCTDDENEVSTNDSEIPTSNLTLNLQGLEDLGSDFLYEGWVIVDGSPVTTGTFSVDANGSLSATEFEVPANTLEEATAFVLTIEPNPDPDPAPAATKYLQGEFSGNSASVSINSVVADFTGSEGVFFLRTPTDETEGNNGNDENGIWFGIPTTMPPGPGLTLPALQPGWVYEGWVIGEAPITTGTFTSLNEADNEAPYSGTEQPGPPIPGEDFFLNAPTGETFPLDVRGRAVVISVEPVPDNSPAPFALKPLTGTAGQETAPATHTLTFGTGTFPSGTVTR